MMLIAKVHGVLVQVEIWNNLRTVTDPQNKAHQESFAKTFRRSLLPGARCKVAAGLGTGGWASPLVCLS